MVGEALPNDHLELIEPGHAGGSPPTTVSVVAFG
jgi:hypothetical protein